MGGAMVNLSNAIGKIAVSLTIIVSAFHVESASANQVAKQLEALHWYSEEYPPYNFADENGVPTGMAVDILIAAFAKIGVSSTRENIDIVPWNRSYKFIQRRPGTALFSMTYTPERQKLMKFVGPSVPSNISIIGLTAR
jgi:ABC-type amino acid transport substrate-binding protein